MTVVTEATKEISTFEIPEYNIPVVESKIAKLNKRAAKLGAEPIQIVVRLMEMENMGHSLVI